MAACSEERKPRPFGIMLPPITLSNTTVSSLLTLVPVLVAMTSSSSTPKFEDEADRPAWWPKDVQWKNPKDYCYMGDLMLRSLLRKVIHSCYSYHGVEDLLCRIDDSPKVDEDAAPLSDVDGDVDGNTSSATNHDTDGPVFVCCFCLEEFDSHKSVSAHQRVCLDKSKSTTIDSGPTMQDCVDNPEGIHNTSITPFDPSKNTTKVYEVPNTAPHPVSLTVSQYCLPDNDLTIEEIQDITGKSDTQSRPVIATKKDAPKSTTASSSSNSRRQPMRNRVKPILKTRSQKKLDQIMDRHKKRKMMIQECRQLKEVPKTGAWWIKKKSRQRHQSSTVYPCERLTKQEFLSGMGLSLKKTRQEQSIASTSVKKEVDLDCEIISVEGPLSMNLPPCFQNNPSNTDSNATSPRASRSLMSQMSRDDSTRSARRRISSLCFVEDEWADREAINEGRDPRQMCLMTLDLSSPLGQRIRKFVKVDRSMNVVKDVESCCFTEYLDDSKLRVRGCDFKVTYKRKCRATSWVHKYKFNKSHVREFERHLKTGLSRRSRYLQRILSNCRVVLRQISERDIELYNMEKKVTIAENIQVDDDLCITQIDIPEEGLKRLKNRPFPMMAPPSGVGHGPKLSDMSSSSHDSYGQGFHGVSHAHRKQQYQPRQTLANNLPSTNHHHPRHHRPPLPPSFHRHPTSFPSNTSSNHCPSPPHIPNIFRNRSNSNTPPPIPTLKDSLSSYKQALSSLHSTGAGRHSSSHNHQPHHHKPHRPHNHHHHHHHQQQQNNSRPSPSPSGFSSGVIIEHHQRLQQHPPGPNANSRRKQPMNQVRHDDSFNMMSSRNMTASASSSSPISPHNPATKRKESFINLANKPLSNHSPSSSSSSSSQPSSSSPSSFARHGRSQGHHSSQNRIADDAVRTQGGNSQDNSHHSNFKHFNIKQGKISSGHSLPSANLDKELVNSWMTSTNKPPNYNQSKKGSPNVAHSNPFHHHHHQQQQQQNSYSNNGRHSTSPHLNRGDHHHHHPHSVHRPRHSSLLNNHSNHSHSTGQQQQHQAANRRVSEIGRPSKHKLGPRSFQLAQSGRSRPHPPPSPSSFSKTKTTTMPSTLADNDVMEVICIDD